MTKPLTGKFETPQKPPSDRPPLVGDEINRVIAEHARKHKLPDCIPQPLSAVASWWLNTVEPDRYDEGPRSVSLVGDDGLRWVCPYHNRVIYTLRKFLQMAPKEQSLIVAAREDGVFWRGEDMDFFMRVINETQRMRKIGGELYRAECLKKLKIALSKGAYGHDKQNPHTQTQTP